MSSLYSVFNVLLTGGDEQIRTVDPLLARQVLSQLSYTPISQGFPTVFESFLGPSKLNNVYLDPFLTRVLPLLTLDVG